MRELIEIKKKEVIKKHQKHPADTGSTEVQIAILTMRINHLSEHLQKHKKDFSSRLGLLKLVGKRNALLKYLKENEPEKYKALIAELGLRK